MNKTKTLIILIIIFSTIFLLGCTQPICGNGICEQGEQNNCLIDCPNEIEENNTEYSNPEANPVGWEIPTLTFEQIPNEPEQELISQIEAQKSTNTTNNYWIYSNAFTGLNGWQTINTTWWYYNGNNWAYIYERQAWAYIRDAGNLFQVPGNYYVNTTPWYFTQGWGYATNLNPIKKPICEDSYCDLGEESSCRIDCAFGIEIIGSTDCITKTRNALALLKNRANNHYSVATQYIGIIECINQGSGIYSWENPPRYVVGEQTLNSGSIWYAGTIVHDSIHSVLYNDYLEEHPGSPVPQNVYSGENAESICIHAQYDALTKLGASQYTLEYVRNSLETQWWNVPYEDRNW